MGKNWQKKKENGPRPDMGKKWPKNGEKIWDLGSFFYFFAILGHFSPNSGRGPFSISWPIFSHFWILAYFPFYTRRPDSQHKPLFARIWSRELGWSCSFWRPLLIVPSVTSVEINNKTAELTSVPTLWTPILKTNGDRCSCICICMCSILYALRPRSCRHHRCQTPGPPPPQRSLNLAIVSCLRWAKTRVLKTDTRVSKRAF